MRLKTLRKERPAFENQGIIINGNRIDLPETDSKLLKSRTNKKLTSSVLNESTNLSSYQTIETTCLDHGIRINLNPVPRSKTSNRPPTLLHCPITTQMINQQSRIFSSLSRTSTINVEQTEILNISQTQQNDIEHHTYCASSIVPSEYLDPLDEKTSLRKLIGNDPDLAYMSSLLQKTSGTTFQDANHRRLGIRLPPTMYRHSQQNRSHSNPLIHHDTIDITPLSASSRKNIEKDILKHASRIRTNHLQDSSTHYHQRFSKPPIKESLLSVSNSSIKLNHSNKQNSSIKSSKPISLEPLKLLLKHSHQSKSSHPTLLSSNDIPSGKKKRTKSHTIQPIINAYSRRNEINGSVVSDEHLKSTLLSDESSLAMKILPTDKIMHGKTQQSNSFDSGCDDHSSNCSGDSHNRTFSSNNQALSSNPSIRFNSVSSTRRSHSNKKVSFEDQSLTVVITSSIYV
ncbi:hypothetical protein I4U23_006886 [Adineta vaga]|nr:hypothetical protein I4U23_006886 [Adineta vaga]